MLLICCPFCGPRAGVEFKFERALETIVGPEMPATEAMSRLYTRDNPRGVSGELWRHSFGCGAWLMLQRDTATHEISSVTLFEAHP